MSEIKVIAVTANSDLLAALAKVLGTSVEALVSNAVQGNPFALAELPEVEEVVPAPLFGEVVSQDENDVRFKYVYAVPEAARINVRATVQGVRVEAENVGALNILDTTLAPAGGFDDVTAVYDDVDETLTVRLFKLAEGGKEIEVIGFESLEEEDTEYAEEEECCDCDLCRPSDSDEDSF